MGLRNLKHFFQAYHHHSVSWTAEMLSLPITHCFLVCLLEFQPQSSTIEGTAMPRHVILSRAAQSAGRTFERPVPSMSGTTSRLRHGHSADIVCYITYASAEYSNASPSASESIPGRNTCELTACRSEHTQRHGDCYTP